MPVGPIELSDERLAIQLRALVFQHSKRVDAHDLQTHASMCDSLTEDRVLRRTGALCSGDHLLELLLE